MTNTLGRIVHKVWNKLPDGTLKEKIRVFQRNYLTGNSNARFKLQNGIFSIAIDGAQFRTIDHPFAITQENYQKKYKLKDGDVCIDAGAYNGHLSLFFSLKVGPSGRIIAIEPDAKNLVLINKNLILNSFIHNITVINCLLWSVSSKVEFSEQGTVGSSVFYRPAGKPVIKKDAITIDDLIESQKIPKVDLIKMDIEGAEVDALKGAAGCIKKYRPNFAIASYHIVNNVQTRLEVEQLLKQYDYLVETISYGTECITYASR